MNWIAVGAIAEVVGVVAIFVSLIYVAVQIRQNTQQIAHSVDAERLAAFERSVESGNRIRELLVVNPDLAALFLSGLDNYHRLASTEKLRFSMLLRNMFSAIQGAYVRQLSIAHDPLGFDGQENLIDTLLASAGVREWLASNDPDWHPEFRQFVDERLAFIRNCDDA